MLLDCYSVKRSVGGDMHSHRYILIGPVRDVVCGNVFDPSMLSSDIVTSQYKMSLDLAKNWHRICTFDLCFCFSGFP